MYDDEIVIQHYHIEYKIKDNAKGKQKLREDTLNKLNFYIFHL